MNRLPSPSDALVPPLLVLDTNVVLDWLVFRDPACDALGHALLRSLVQWVSTTAMRDEFEHVLARGGLDAWRPDPQATRTSWDRWARMVPEPPQAPAHSPRCSDPDDQKFIDLAITAGANALLSRDRAVLRCARGAHAHGLAIVTPSAWALR